MLRLAMGAAFVACWVAVMPTMATAADRSPAAGVRASAPADYRLHVPVADAPPAPIIDAPGSRLRSGFGNAMVGLYPLPNSGLHVAAGGRLFGRIGRPSAAAPDADRLLAMPRGTGVGGRIGRRRPSPTMLVGVDRPMANGLVVGIDGGAAMGRLYNSPGRLGRLGAGGGSNGGRLNELGRVTMSLRF